MNAYHDDEFDILAKDTKNATFDEDDVDGNLKEVQSKFLSKNYSVNLDNDQTLTYATLLLDLRVDDCQTQGLRLVRS